MTFHSMTASVLLGAIIAGTVGANAFCSEKKTIIENGKSDYEIIIKADAPKTSTFAAEELKHYFKKVAGADIPVKTELTPDKKAIYIGANSLLPPKPEFDPRNYVKTEKFIITGFDGNIVIMGADCDMDPVAWNKLFGDFGVLFGVYEFIERFLGVRWYAPGELGECYTEKVSVDVCGLPIRQKPTHWRRYYWPNVFNESTRHDSRVWTRRMKGFGNKALNANHSMMDMHFLFKDTRPEIFALNLDGTRNFGKLKGEPALRKWEIYPQYCFTNPETLKSYKEMIDACYNGDPIGKEWKNCRPDENFIYVVPDDNYRVSPCYCKNCQAKTDISRGSKGLQSNLVWGFVAAIAKYAKEKYPDKKVVGLAYEGYLLPPTDVKLPENVIVNICVNPYIIYSGLPEYEKQVNDNIAEWAKVVNEISIWHYYMPYASFPYMMPRQLVKWHNSHPEIKACFIELMDKTAVTPPHKGSRVGSDLAQVHLNLYFSMKAFWDGNFDVEKELELYYEFFFGPAAAPMKEFHEMAISRWENVRTEPQNSPYPSFSGKDLYEKIYPKEVTDKLSALFEKALSLTKAESIYRRRLEWINDSYFKDFIVTAEAFQREASSSKSMALFPAREKPEIDGNIEKDYWKKKEAIHLVRNHSPLAPRFPAYFKMGIDKDNLYLALRAEDPHNANQKLTCTEHDSMVYGDDSYEIFICPDADNPERYYQIVVNLNDIVFDQAVKNDKGGVKWTSEIVSKTRKHEGYWTSEIALPLKNMDIDTEKNSVWRFNLCRNKKSGVGENHERSQWGATYGSFSNYQAFPNLYIIWDETKSRRIFNGSEPVPPRLDFRLFRKDSPKPEILKKFTSIEKKEGYTAWHVEFPAPEIMFRNYAVFLLPQANDADVSGMPFCEVRFRNPDQNVSITVTYAFLGADGEKYSDWYRLSSNVAYEKWHVKSLNIQTDGHVATKRIKSGGKGFPEPRSITYFALYSGAGGNSERKAQIDIDYIRFTGNPISEIKITE